MPSLGASPQKSRNLGASPQIFNPPNHANFCIFELKTVCKRFPCSARVRSCLGLFKSAQYWRSDNHKHKKKSLLFVNSSMSEREREQVLHVYIHANTHIPGNNGCWKHTQAHRRTTIESTRRAFCSISLSVCVCLCLSVYLHSPSGQACAVWLSKSVRRATNIMSA